MMLPRIKVCGLARVEDAIAARAAGADALGVVQFPSSPRSVDAELAAEIFAAAQSVDQRGGAKNGGSDQGNVDLNPKPPLCVAVMVDLEPQQALTWATAAGATAVQLCGSENPEHYRDFPLPILRRIGVDETGPMQMQEWIDVAQMFVLDHPASAGGSGMTVDFALAARLCQHAPCLLAGGLGADNVADAIATVQPWGVDASSRLEHEPGRKNLEYTALFVARARRELTRLQPE
jgi:phosphoribosylanthranilate isomerase